MATATVICSIWVCTIYTFVITGYDDESVFDIKTNSKYCLYSILYEQFSRM